MEFRSDPKGGKFSFYALTINSTVTLLLMFVSSVYSVQLKNPFFIFPASSSSSMKSSGRKLRPVPAASARNLTRSFPAASARNLTRSFQCLTCSTPRCLRHVVGSFSFCYYWSLLYSFCAVLCSRAGSMRSCSTRFSMSDCSLLLCSAFWMAIEVSGVLTVLFGRDMAAAT